MMTPLNYVTMIIYIIGIIIFSVLYFKLNMARDRISNIVFFVAILFFLMNTYMTILDPTGEYDEELKLYTYVETNGISLLPFAISIAALIYALKIKFQNHDKITFFYNILISIFCFICIAMIIWIPKGSSFGIRVLRACKTLLLLTGGFFIIFSLLHLRKKLKL